MNFSIVHKFSYFCLVLVFMLSFAFVSFASISDVLLNATAGFFPTTGQLQKSKESWSQSAPSLKLDSPCSYNSKGYLYSNNVSEVYFGVTRDKTFNLDVRIISCNSVNIANEKYQALASVGDDKLKASVAIGDQGILLIQPKSKTQIDYYLTYIVESFIVQVHSSDGFSLMDSASIVNNNIVNFIESNKQYFNLNKISLTVKANGFVTGEENILVSSTTDGVVINGTVLNNELEPILNATVSIPSLKVSATTNKYGEFSLSYNDKGKQIFATERVFYVSKTTYKNIPEAIFGIYRLKESGTNILDLDMKVVKNTKDGSVDAKVFDKTKNYEFPTRVSFEQKGDNTSVKMTLFCNVPNSIVRCVRQYNGTYENGIISGVWSGNGGNGIFTTTQNQFARLNTTIRLNSDDIAMRTVTFVNGTLQQVSTSKMTVSSGQANSTFIQILLKKDLQKIYPDFEPFYLEQANLVLYDLPQLEQYGKLNLYKYEINQIDNNSSVAIKSVNKVALLIQSKIVQNISIPVNYNESNILIGTSTFAIDKEATHTLSDMDNSIYGVRLYLSYYVPVDKLNINPISVKETNDKLDYATNSNLIQKDGKNDITLEVKFNKPFRTLSNVEFEVKGKPFKWNTNGIDEYPTAVVRQDKHILNSVYGFINSNLDYTQTYYIHLYKPTTLQAGDILQYSFTIDDKVYTGSVAISSI